MSEFFAANLGTIATGLVVLAIATAIVIKLVRDKRRGKCCSCGCGGGDCPQSDNAD
jgi:hypothetical protein